MKTTRLVSIMLLLALILLLPACQNDVPGISGDIANGQDENSQPKYVPVYNDDRLSAQSVADYLETVVKYSIISDYRDLRSLSEETLGKISTLLDEKFKSDGKCFTAEVQDGTFILTRNRGYQIDIFKQNPDGTYTYEKSVEDYLTNEWTTTTIGKIETYNGRKAFVVKDETILDISYLDYENIEPGDLVTTSNYYEPATNEIQTTMATFFYLPEGCTEYMKISEEITGIQDFKEFKYNAVESGDIITQKYGGNQFKDLLKEQKLIIDEDGWHGIESISPDKKTITYTPDANNKIGSSFASPVLKDILESTEFRNLELVFTKENTVDSWTARTAEPVTPEFIETIKPTIESHGFTKAPDAPDFILDGSTTRINMEDNLIRLIK